MFTCSPSLRVVSKMISLSLFVIVMMCVNAIWYMRGSLYGVVRVEWGAEKRKERWCSVRELLDRCVCVCKSEEERKEKKRPKKWRDVSLFIVSLFPRCDKTRICTPFRCNAKWSAILTGLTEVTLCTLSPARDEISHYSA